MLPMMIKFTLQGKTCARLGAVLRFRRLCGLRWAADPLYSLVSAMTLPDTVLLADSFTYLFAYYVVGVFVYFVLEHWNLETALYFITQASFTVSYGDIAPHYPASRLFTVVYVPIGTAMLYHAALPQGRQICAFAASLIPGLGSYASVPVHDEMGIVRTLPGLVLVGAVGAGLSYYFCEMSPINAVYFAFSTSTAAGYGDIAPQGRMQMILSMPFIFAACGTFAAVLEACHTYAKLVLVRKTPLARVADQLLLQPTPWDFTVGGAHRCFASKADLGHGLSEPEFMLAVLCGHGIVDVQTLLALRKEFAALTQTAENYAKRISVAGGSGGEVAADDAPIGDNELVATGPPPAAAAPPVLGARAIFAINLAENRVQPRPADKPVGTSEEALQREGDTYRTLPTAFVDLTAADGGFAEWHEHYWLKMVNEERANAAIAMGTASTASTGGEDGVRPMNQRELV